MSILPQPNTLPSNEHEASKLLQKLGLAYKVIHACPKGQMLLCGFHENDQNCHKYKANRFKAVGTSLVPQKVLRHFPIIPRLKWMYNTLGQASLMTWHVKNRSSGAPCSRLTPMAIYRWKVARVCIWGTQHPTWTSYRWHQPLCWKQVNLERMACDVPELQSPWMTTKNHFVMLSMIISSQESVTGDSMDVYLEPLLEELQ